MNTSSTLAGLVEAILKDAGFEEDAYIFIDRGDEVFIDFDDKPAADYLISIADDMMWKDSVATSYQKNGKRHRVLFFLW
jgi:hypothetical protein